MFRPIENKDERERGEAPKFFEIYMVFKAYGNKFCPDCLKCVEICPEQAINIKF
jgi:ferredoxin